MSKNLKVNVGGKGVVDLGGPGYQYVGAGGQASIYAGRGTAYKLFSDAFSTIPQGKIQELMAIQAPNVIRPIDLLYAADGRSVGYSMRYLEDAIPICKFFTKSFKVDNNVDPAMVVTLVRALQETIAAIHADHCLVVDLNELNVLVSPDLVSPYFIDTDSFQTPHYPATAIMDSVRDRLGRPGAFTDLTDWFSFAVMATQLYLNIHPYKGRHPRYLLSELNRRMDDNVSIFHKGVCLPAVCNPLSVIPPRHLEWLKAVFLRQERSCPPLPDSGLQVAVLSSAVPLPVGGRFQAQELFSLDSDVVFWIQLFGADYFVTRKAIYCGQKELCKVDPGARRTLLTSADSGDPVVVSWDGGRKVSFADITGRVLGKTVSPGAFIRNQAVYTFHRGRVLEHTFVRIGASIVCRSRAADQVSELGTALYPGLLLQNLLGRHWATIPYALGRCASLPLPELDGYRVVDARSQRNIAVVVAEKKGAFHRFVYDFDPAFKGYTCRHAKDVSYDGINFTVLDNGLCLLLASDALELSNKGQVRSASDSPLTAATRLFHKANSVFYLNGPSVFSLKMAS